jgi:hypothetical protein
MSKSGTAISAHIIAELCINRTPKEAFESGYLNLEEKGYFL